MHRKQISVEWPVDFLLGVFVSKDPINETKGGPALWDAVTLNGEFGHDGDVESKLRVTGDEVIMQRNLSKTPRATFTKLVMNPSESVNYHFPPLTGVYVYILYTVYIYIGGCGML